LQYGLAISMALTIAWGGQLLVDLVVGVQNRLELVLGFIVGVLFGTMIHQVMHNLVIARLANVPDQRDRLLVQYHDALIECVRSRSDDGKTADLEAIGSRTVVSRQPCPGGAAMRTLLWLSTLIGLLPQMLLAILYLVLLALVYWSSRNPDVIVYIGEMQVGVGSLKPMHISSSPWPSVLILLGASVLLVGMWFLTCPPEPVTCEANEPISTEREAPPGEAGG
jgi:hypothetical protein